MDTWSQCITALNGSWLENLSLKQLPSQCVLQLRAYNLNCLYIYMNLNALKLMNGHEILLKYILIQSKLKISYFHMV